MDVRDKVVVITGAARGIGQEFAQSLAAAGAHIVAADINNCSATLGLVEAQGAKAIGVTVPPWAWRPRQPGHSDISTR
jgi:NAD(P)-dependent dehydrogenase (short-subunit alcohol dehydrogenase family)